MNDIIHLHKLQTIDHQLDKISVRISEIERILGTDEELEAALAASQIATDKLNQEKLKLRKLEDLGDKQRIKIETDEASLYSGRIQNPKELRDLQNEIISLKKSQAQLEEQILEIMLRVEQADDEQKLSASSLSRAQASSIERHAMLKGELADLRKQIDRLQIEKSAATISISPENMETYLLLRKQKRGTAISLIVDGACSSCGSTLTPAERQSARSPQQTVFCSSCGRILYAG